MLTIVVYHYVRELERSRFPRIKGRRTAEFDAQLDYIDRHYNVVALRDVLAALRDKRPLPPAPCVLSFDDGLSDHFETVFPRLTARGFTGVFFPSARPVHEHIVLDVHKLHFVLASAYDHAALLLDVLHLVSRYRRDYDIPDAEQLAARYGSPGVYDPPETAFIKRLLQHGLPPAVRADIVDLLFRKHVAVDEREFSAELYMDADQLRQLHDAGMEIGGHGDRHEHIGLLTIEQQIRELCATRAFLKELGVLSSRNGWTMCYPYGSFSDASLRIAAAVGCALTLSTRAGLMQLPLTTGAHPMPVLDRLDTNDLPCMADTPACEWTRRAISV